MHLRTIDFNDSRGWSAASVAILSLALASPVVAQGQTGTQHPAGLIDALAALQPGSVIRLRVGPHVVEGTYERDTPLCLILREASIPDDLALGPCERSDGDTFLVPTAAVERLQERGHAAGRGVAIGALVGGAGGALYGALLAYGLDADAGEGVEAVFLLGAIGAGGGAIVGAGLGWPVERWHTRYP